MLNIFRKKKIEVPTIKVKTVLCIPGNWKDRTEIVTSIVQNNPNEFLFAGNILLDLQTKQGYEMVILEHDDQMKTSFAYAGMVNAVSEDLLEKIGQHHQVVYLIGETGNTVSAKAMAKAGAAVLKAGGIGLKVESTGKAFTKEQWLELCEHDEISALYEMYVLGCINDGNKTYTCGMHNLGLRDTIVYDEDVQESIDLLSSFGHYLLIENPMLRNGHTFSPEQDAPIFVITEETIQPNKGNELFENPYGMWKLERI